MTARAHDHLARVRELDRIGNQVDEHLPQPAGVADRALGHKLSDVQHQLDALVGGSLGEELDRLLHHVLGAEVNRLQANAARLDLREIEDVVDDLQQRISRGANRVDVLALLERQLGVEQETRHADDPVHRRADLVAHRGQEL